MMFLSQTGDILKATSQKAAPAAGMDAAAMNTAFQAKFSGKDKGGYPNDESQLGI